LFGGLTYLGVPFTAKDIYALVHKIAIQNDGLVSYPDFKRVFSSGEEDIESRNMGEEGMAYEAIEPISIPELNDPDTYNKTLREQTVALTQEILEAFKVKVKTVNGFNPVWNSQNTSSRSQVSIWNPTLDTGWSGASKTRICLGHYASQGFNSPSRLPKKEKAAYQTIELTDVATLRMKRAQTLSSVLANIFPHPVRFKSSWHMKRGIFSVYAWKAIAPEHFIAMGHVFTKDEREPDPSIMRCVPMAWTTKTTRPPIKIWDDTGAGGGKAGSMWIINNMNMVVLIPGHDQPSIDECREFNSQKFFFEGDQIRQLLLK
jgi:hypothetical protein